MKVRFPAGVLINMGESVKGTYPGKLPTRVWHRQPGSQRFHPGPGLRQKNRPAKEPPPVNLKLEALELALAKKIPVMFSAHRSGRYSHGVAHRSRVSS